MECSRAEEELTTTRKSLTDIKSSVQKLVSA